MQAQIASKEDTTANNDSGELWFCMQCFETRCGRYDNQHSLKHYESEPSHCLTLCVSNYTIWCYKCDRYIAQELIKGKLESSLSLAKKVFSNSKKPHSPCRNLSHIDLPIEDTITRNFRVIGLNNLGNTCYFNSALQNLLYLSTFKRELCYTLDRTEFTLVPKKHPNLEPITFSYITNAATAPGALTNALSHLIKQTKIKQHDLSIGKKPHSKKCVISPKESTASYS
ncbi:Ubiquitin carboxyl-terminal hydrolase 16-like isoform X1 [Oopsacas minuta]|uniref:Ubiquitin carboxyl-terminal hydrolase 16-like isoform X1 n=1 Tax=Oopsacas minuta TaxID=111878 RepID=A0AAV7JVV8_9METZ|nr:Ubiquitin carboxyl-terminal hydrolase 16-like isoform X1 [Oopsacas minuta]